MSEAFVRILVAVITGLTTVMGYLFIGICFGFLFAPDGIHIPGGIGNLVIERCSLAVLIIVLIISVMMLRKTRN